MHYVHMIVEGIGWEWLGAIVIAALIMLKSFFFSTIEKDDENITPLRYRNIN